MPQENARDVFIRACNNQSKDRLIVSEIFNHQEWCKIGDFPR